MARFPVAITTGNTSIIKPSERDPGATLLLMEMLNEAGCPPGVVNVIHGANDSVNFICDHPDIKAVSFVGSDQAGKHIYERAGRNGKRVQSNMGAKNHGVIMADANKNATLNQLAGGKFMFISVKFKLIIFKFLIISRFWSCWSTLYGFVNSYLCWRIP